MTSSKARRAQERRRLWRKEYRAAGMTDELQIERAVWTRQLRNDGLSDEAIARHLDSLTCQSIAVRSGDKEAANRMVYGEHDAYVTPDDSKFRPASVPAELRGNARATGQAAKAVRTGKTVTKWQHDQRESP